MAESQQMADLARQARQHLESLRAAGVEWLPLAAAPVVSPPAAIGESGASEAAVLRATEAAQLFASSGERPSLDPQERRQALVVLQAEVAQCVRCAELA